MTWVNSECCWSVIFTPVLETSNDLVLNLHLLDHLRMKAPCVDYETQRDLSLNKVCLVVLVHNFESESEDLIDCLGCDQSCFALLCFDKCFEAVTHQRKVLRIWHKMSSHMSVEHLRIVLLPKVDQCWDHLLNKTISVVEPSSEECTNSCLAVVLFQIKWFLWHLQPLFVEIKVLV